MSKQAILGLLFIACMALLVFNIFDTDAASMTRLRLAFMASSGAMIGFLFGEWLRARNESRKVGAAK